MIKDNDVFNSMLDADPDIDYTGKKANFYTEKFTNRPDDMGTMEGLHNTLSGVGFVNPLADAVNSAIYVLEGDYMMAGLSAAAILPMGTIFAKGAKGRKIISENITKGDDYFSKYNRQLNDLGQNSKYINEQHILDGNYAISHTNRAIKDGQRAAVIVKVKNLKTGNVTYQPFYRSTGTGHSASSQYNWLPFEGMMPSTGAEVVIKTAKNRSRKFWSADESVAGWEGRITEKTPSGGIRFKEGMAQSGWYIKAFKNYKGDLIDSSVGGKIKRGLKAHEEIDFYLRNKLNFDLIPKNLKNIDVEKTALGVKPTKEIKELSPIEQKVYDIFHDPIKRENFSKSYAKVISDNLKRYPGKK